MASQTHIINRKAQLLEEALNLFGEHYIQYGSNREYSELMNMERWLVLVSQLVSNDTDDTKLDTDDTKPDTTARRATTRKKK